MRNVVLVAIVVAAACAPATVHADSRTDPTHVAAELANAVAQGKVTLTPTPQATATPRPADTATPAQVAPAPAEPPTATPEPGLPVPTDTDSPVAGYIRPSLMGDGVTLELALPRGRWDVRLAGEDCALPWTNVWLDASLTVTTDGTDHGCTVTGANWRSDAPCAVNEYDQCDVLADLSYWYMVSQLPTDVPTPTPLPVAAPPRAPPSQPALQPAPAPAPARIVYVQLPAPTSVPPTATPKSTDTPTPTPRATATATPTATAVPTHTPTHTATPTNTARPTATPRVTATPVAPISVDEPPAVREPITVDPLSQEVPVPMLALGLWYGVRPTGEREWHSSQP